MPILRSELHDAEVPDAAQVEELEVLARSIPKLIGVLPDALHDRSDPRHNVALSEMISRLTFELDAVQPLALVSTSAILAQRFGKSESDHFLFVMPGFRSHSRRSDQCLLMRLLN